MEYTYYIKRWQNYQHYTSRTPPWIKLHREQVLDDPDWHQLDPKAAKVLVMLWLIAAEDPTKAGNLPCSKKLAFRLRMPENVVKSTMNKLWHWVGSTPLAAASTMLAERYHDATSETETETETEEISCEAEPSREVALRVLDFLNQKTGRTFRPFEGANGKRKPTASLEFILARLNGGATEQDMRGVIARKCRDWLGDPKMAKFCRPATLFNRTNYDQYVGEQAQEESIS